MFRLRSRKYKRWLYGEGNAAGQNEDRDSRRPNRRRLNDRAPSPQEHNDANLEGPQDNLPENNPDLNLQQQDANNGGDINASSGSEESEDERQEDCNACDCDVCTNNFAEPRDSIFKETQAYADKFDLNAPLTEHLQVKKFEVFLMILTIVMRHGFTGQLVSDLLTFVNTILGKNVLPTSYYVFQKLFSVDAALTFHFVCDHCNLYLGKHGSFEGNETVCPNCRKLCNVRRPVTTNEGSFFITMSVRQQLQEVVKRSGQHIVTRTAKDDNSISDICDGKLYKSMCAEGQPLSNPLALTLTIGTDGGQVFNNSYNNSMWPIQVICNELDPKDRFRPHNMMLAGLWFGKNSPNMSAFFKPLSEELKCMETNGVSRTLRDGREVSCPVFTLFCVCDSVAKPKVQNILQFNGYHGCGYCVQKGIFVEECSSVRFPFKGKRYKLRTEHSVKDAMRLAEELGETEMGVKGLSPLLLLPSVHLVFGIPIDYMHAVLLGVVKRIVGLWFSETSTGKRYYIKKHEDDIDRRLNMITPPSQLTTRPKAISQRSSWKAKDWLIFLLYFGIPCLEGFLTPIYLDNFKNLSNGIFLLLKESITRQELENARDFLDSFVLNFNLLYGDQNMVYNTHLLTHLVEIVEICGPLSMYSAFSFEGGIGFLVKLVKGTQSVAAQICRKYLAAKCVPSLLIHYDIWPPVQDYCDSILMYRRNKQSFNINNISLLGGQKLVFLPMDKRELLSNFGYRVDNYVATYNRAIMDGTVFTSQNYKRPKKTNDTCVQLASGEFGVIDLIVLVQEPHINCLIFFRPIRICQGFETVKHVLHCALDTYEEVKIVQFSDIKTKCIHFSVGDKIYLSYRPNEFERD